MICGLRNESAKIRLDFTLQNFGFWTAKPLRRVGAIRGGRMSALQMTSQAEVVARLVVAAAMLLRAVSGVLLDGSQQHGRRHHQPGDHFRL